MKRLSILFITVVILVCAVNTSFADETTMSEEPVIETYRAKVLKIESIKEEYPEANITLIKQKVDARILNGGLKGEIVEAENNMSGNPAYDIELKEGDIISLGMEQGENGERLFHVKGYERTRYVYQLIGIFLVLLVIAGGWKGLKSIVSLGVTIGLVFYVMIPLLLKGISPIFISIGVCAAATIITMIVITGWNKKSLAAIIGTIGGITAGGGIAYLYGLLAQLTGLSEVEAQMLLDIPQQVKFDFRGLLFAGILIGALGAAMDVSVSIASALTELIQKDRNLTFRQILKHGMNIGKDIMGTMSNTLILAYTGGALSMILLFVVYPRPVNDIINFDFVATEIIRSIAGSIGLIFAIPITAISFGLMHKKNESR
ncbi:MAG: YibE/F family protein [Firmicutes bacterium]|nr:YibE/F family protein [Bacillota bacterium]